MAKELKFKAQDASNFVAWLKKFSSINDSLLLEIDYNNGEFIAKTYNEEKSVVKFSKISFLDSGLELEKKKGETQRVKVGLHSISKVIKTLGHFSGKEFELNFKYDTLEEDDGSKTFSGVSLLFKNSELKVGISCSPLNIFKYISDELFKQNIANVNSVFSFSFTKETSEKINSLIKLDSDYKYIKFLNKNDGSVFARSKSFEYNLDNSSVNTEHSLEVLKDQFIKVDIENYSCDIGEDRAVFKSNDSETIAVLSEVERNDNYEESEEENLE